MWWSEKTSKYRVVVEDVMDEQGESAKNIN